MTDYSLTIASFWNVTKSFNFQQHGRTHVKGNTLDLVFITDVKINTICTEDLCWVTSVSCLIHCSTMTLNQRSEVKCSSTIYSLTVEQFASRFDSYTVDTSFDDRDLMVDSFNSHCSHILDEVASMVTKKVLAVNHLDLASVFG